MQPVFAPRTTRARVMPYLAAGLALTLAPLGLALGLLWAPTAVIPLADGGTQRDLAQKIFYLHVPVAFAAYWCFAAGAWNGLLHLLRGRVEHDLRSYAGVHSGMVFGTLVIVTGSLWAKAAWGTWWQWGDRQLIVFLVLYLYYASYFMLRFSIDPGRTRQRAAAVHAVLGAGLVPLSFLAIRIADTLIHPVVLEPGGGTMEREMWIAFLVATGGFIALAHWMLQLEVVAKLRARRVGVHV